MQVGVVRPQFNVKKQLDLSLVSRRQTLYEHTQKPLNQKPPGPRIHGKPYSKDMKYVLYTHSNCSISSKISQYVHTNSLPVFTQDVSKLQNKPEWLRGVPTLVDTYNGSVVTGSQALDTIYNIRLVAQSLPKIDEKGTTDINRFGRALPKVTFDTLFAEPATPDIPQKNIEVSEKAIDDLLAKRNINKLSTITEDGQGTAEIDKTINA